MTTAAPRTARAPGAAPRLGAELWGRCSSSHHSPCSPHPVYVPGLPSVAPPSVRPSPRPDVSPPATGTFLLYAQGQQIGYLPLNGTRLQKEAAKTLLSLHVEYLGQADTFCISLDHPLSELGWFEGSSHED